MEPASTFSLSWLLNQLWVLLVGWFWWKARKSNEESKDLHSRVYRLELDSRHNNTAINHLRELIEVKLNNIEGNVQDIKETLKNQ